MKVIQSPQISQKIIQALKKRGRKIGFVPTMGYLHEGHLSLVRKAKKENDTVVVSIFVNPLQFGPKEDLKRYPSDLKRDSALLKKEGIDFLFLPKNQDFYPKDFQTEVKVKALSQDLCGKSRPVHFAGVATVVLKLLHLIPANNLYVGLKDYQQYRVVSQMVKDLSLPVKVIGCSIVREKDGLAMSSRNIFLSENERQQALLLPQALKKAKQLIEKGERRANTVLDAAKKSLSRANKARLDYLEIVDALTLEPMIQLKANSTVLVAAAVYFSKTRLIDNCLAKVR